MLSPETYREAYGLEIVETLPGFPPLYSMPRLFGRPVLVASPYVTNTLYPERALNQWPDYVASVVALGAEHHARYVLLKIEREDLAAALGDRFVIDLGYTKSVLDLTAGRDHIFEHVIPSKTRNQIRKGQKLKYDERLGREVLLDDFYAVMSITQTELGTPVHHRRYYAAILSHNPTAELFVLYLNGRPVSAALLLEIDRTFYHPYAGTLNRVKSTCINNLLYWRIIELAIARGASTFDLGRSIKGSGNERYKRSWGGKEHQLYLAYSLAPGETPPRYDSTLVHLATSAWRHLPTAAAQLFGHHFIRHVP